MDVSRFIDPEEEQIFNTDDNIDDQILAQFGPEVTAESDEEDQFAPPRISVQEALDYLQRLRIFEQYSDVGDGDMVGNINREEDGGGEAEETAQHSRLFRLNYAIPRDNHNPCINIVNGGTNVMLIVGFY